MSVVASKLNKYAKMNTKDKKGRNLLAEEETIFIKSGCVAIDTICGGGIPLGHSIEISSESKLGKSTLVTSIAKSFCKQGLNVVYLDHEKGLNSSLMSGVGVDQYLYYPKEGEKIPDGSFILLKPSTFGEAELTLDAFIEGKSLEENRLDLVIIDSSSAMVVDQFLDKGDKAKSITTQEPALFAKMLGKFLQKYNALSDESKFTIIYISQNRTNLSGFNASIASTGGKAMEFYNHIRLTMKEDRKVTYIKEVVNADGDIEKVKYGNDVSIQAIKNRFCPPYITAKSTIFFGKGVSNISAYIAWLRNTKTIYEGKEVYYIEGSNWYNINIGEKPIRVQGYNKLFAFVRDNMQLVQDIVESNGGFRLTFDEEGGLSDESSDQ